MSITYDLFRTIEDSPVPEKLDPVSTADLLAQSLSNGSAAVEPELHVSPPAAQVAHIADSAPIPRTVENAIQDVLADPRFLPFGGTAVFHCEHRYPHTRADLEGRASLLARSLKGRDAIVLEAVKSCGLHAVLVPLLTASQVGEWEEGAATVWGQCYERGDDDAWDTAPDPGYDDVKECAVAAARAMYRNPVHRHLEQQSDRPNVAAVRELGSNGVEFGSSRGYVMLTELHTPICSHDASEGYAVNSISASLRREQTPAARVACLDGPVVELNTPPAHVAAMQGMAMVYGNHEPSPDFLYSTLALAVTVPRLSDDGSRRHRDSVVVESGLTSRHWQDPEHWQHSES